MRGGLSPNSQATDKKDQGQRDGGEKIEIYLLSLDSREKEEIRFLQTTTCMGAHSCIVIILKS